MENVLTVESETKEKQSGVEDTIRVSLKDKTTGEQERFERILRKFASEKITTLESWKKYISMVIEDGFCVDKARLEMESSKSSNQETGRKPIAIITGGQPGAGKSVLIAMYTNLLKEKRGIDICVNNGDEYRFCVPGTDIIARDFPEHASEVTDPVVKEMRKNLINESIRQEQSIIIENTLGDTLAVDQILEAGVHDVWLAIMAVPREESLLSDFERYIGMKESNLAARLVSVEAHDKRYYALDENVQKLNKKGVRVLVHSRGKTENDLAILEYDSFNKKAKKYSCVLEAISSIRTRSLNESVKGYSERLRIIREKMELFGMTADERKELEKLEQIVTQTILRMQRQIDEQ